MRTFCILTLLLLILTIPGWAVPTVVQSANCSSTTSPMTCTFGSSVTSGNRFFVYVAAGVSLEANNHCTTGNAAYSDTLSSSFFLVIGQNNFGGSFAGVCVMWGQFGASGSESISFAFTGTGAFYMYIIEVSGLPSALVDTSVGSVTNNASTIGATATASTANSFIVCAGVDGNGVTSAQAFTAGSPGTFTALGPGAGGLAKGSAGVTYATGGSGSTSCSFTLAAAGHTEAAVIGIIKYSASPPAIHLRSQVY